MAPAGKPRKWLRWTVVGVVAVLVIVVGGPFVYFQFIEGDPPKPVARPRRRRAPPAGKPRRSREPGRSPSPSVVRYRVKETLSVRATRRSGSTKSMTGSMAIAGTKVSAASFSVDMTSVTSNRGIS